VFEPPDLWQTRIDAAFRDRAPRIQRISILPLPKPVKKRDPHSETTGIWRMSAKKSCSHSGKHAMGRIASSAIFFFISAATNPLLAAVITFDSLNIPAVQPVHEVVEDGMRYTTGIFSILSFVGNPPSALVGSPLSPGPFTVTRDDGGNFTFDRYDFSSFQPPQQSDTWEFRGLLDDVQQFAFFDATSAGFLTRITDLSNPINELDITVVSGSMAAAVADNLVFTLLEVPEPSGINIVVFGLAVLACFGMLRDRARGVPRRAQVIP
jgi:hypothetical protein